MSWLCSAVVLLAPVSALAAIDPATSRDRIAVRTRGPHWRVRLEPGSGGLAPAVVIEFPGATVSEPGQFGSAGVTVALPDAGPAVLHFELADTFIGPTAGYHFAQVLVDGKVAPQPMAALA
jgi:hypothetical protein